METSLVNLSKFILLLPFLDQQTLLKLKIEECNDTLDRFGYSIPEDKRDDLDYIKLFAADVLEDHQHLILDIILCPLTERTFFINSTTFSKENYCERMADVFKQLLRNHDFRYLVNKIINDTTVDQLIDNEPREETQIVAHFLQSLRSYLLTN